MKERTCNICKPSKVCKEIKMGRMEYLSDGFKYFVKQPINDCPARKQLLDDMGPILFNRIILNNKK